MVSVFAADGVHEEDIESEAAGRFTSGCGSLKPTVCHGSEFFYETVGSKDKTIKLYDAHYHNLLNDIGKVQVSSDITDWINSHVSS